MEKQLTTELITKENLYQYKVIDAPADHSLELQSKLKSALRLGNEFKSKSNITFMTDDGPKRIETTVWSLTDKYLQIKGGVLLPLKSLISIDY